MSRYYFGYGSNMNLEQMHDRCPNSTLRGTGTLQGWKFVIGPRGYASIKSDTEKVTHGAIWLLSEYDENHLINAKVPQLVSTGKRKLKSSLKAHL